MLSYERELVRARKPNLISEKNIPVSVKRMIMYTNARKIKNKIIF